MKKAYLIFAYNDENKFRRLLHALNYNCDFYVHLDKKVDDISRFKECVSDMENVFFTNERVVVNWAGWSQVQAIMTMIDAALARDYNYSHLILITETDYPIACNRKIDEYLSLNCNTEFVMAYNCTKCEFKGDLKRIKHMYWYDFPFYKHRHLMKISQTLSNRFILSFIKKNTNVRLQGKTVDIFFGQMLFAITPSCARYVSYIYHNDSNYNKYMKTTFASCELYIQTIVFNSEYREKTIEMGKEHERTEDFSWAPLHKYDYTTDIKIYKEEDFKELISSGKLFFRKAISEYSDGLMDKIDDYRIKEDRLSYGK